MLAGIVVRSLDPRVDEASLVCREAGGGPRFVCAGPVTANEEHTVASADEHGYGLGTASAHVLPAGRYRIDSVRYTTVIGRTFEAGAAEPVHESHELPIDTPLSFDITPGSGYLGRLTVDIAHDHLYRPAVASVEISASFEEDLGRLPATLRDVARDRFTRSSPLLDSVRHTLDDYVAVGEWAGVDHEVEVEGCDGLVDDGLLTVRTQRGHPPFPSNAFSTAMACILARFMDANGYVDFRQSGSLVTRRFGGLEDMALLQFPVEFR